MLNLTQSIRIVTLLIISVPVFSAESEKSISGHSETCPENFYSLPLLPEAKFCQQFSSDLPASLSYHSKNSQESAAQFYIEKAGKAESKEKLKGRIVLQYENGQKIVIISTDGEGSQIDILVKSDN